MDSDLNQTLTPKQRILEVSTQRALHTDRQLGLLGVNDQLLRMTSRIAESTARMEKQFRDAITLSADPLKHLQRDLRLTFDAIHARCKPGL